MEENNEEPVPMQVISSDDEGENNNESRNEGSNDNDDEDDDTSSLENEEGERISGFRRIENILEVLRHPMRGARRNVIRLGFMRRLSQREEEDEDEEPIPDNAEKFDTDLPAEHSYLGTSMVRVSGVEYLEPEKEYRLLIFMHHSMLFPGETLPMIIPEFMFDSSIFPDQGILFGVVFPFIWKMTKPDLYGVTCQIYEKGNDEVGNVILKSRAHQRFIITKKNNSNFSDFLKPHQRKIYANVRILPEIVLPDPLSSIDLGSMNRFRNIKSMSNSLRRMQAATTTWPQFIYNQYDVASIIERAKECLSMYKINSMPNDMVLQSFWLARNLLLDAKKRMEILLTSSVNIRMKIIEKALDNEKYFCCRRCINKIAHGSALFAMSKHGVQSNYCNPSGFIHETNTVFTVLKNSVYPTGTPSTEFSWFPGYSWQIILCRLCDTHIGWKFVSVRPNFVPKKFYGLSGSNIIVSTRNDEDSTRRQNPTNSATSSTSNGVHDDSYLVLYGSNLDIISDE